MKHNIFTILFLFSYLFMFSQNNYWLRVTDSSTWRQAFVDQNGEIMIPYGKYKFILTDTMWYFAFVYKEKNGIVAINRNNQIIFRPLADNLEPDPPSDGLFRIIENNKIGFANMKGEIVIPPRFEAVMRFHHNVAAFCIGCRMEYDTITEYGYWTGGKWGFINKRGEVVVEPQYDDLGIWNNQTVAKKKGVIYLLNERGNIKKKLPSSAKPWFH